MKATESSTAGDRGFYFFLSYAGAPSSMEAAEHGPDVWVTRFFHDLSGQVRRLARPNSGLEPGFMEGHLPPGSAWRARVSAALGLAETFVPLYSPGYVTRSWPLSELASFRRRLAPVPSERARGHVQPVLWVPLAPGSHTSDLDAALELGSRVPEYARNGLLAMCRLRVFRTQYAAILHTLAQRIVAVADHAPLGPAPAPVTIETAVPPSEQVSFVVAVVAPTTDAPPDGRPPAGTAETALAWNPFGGGHTESVSEYAANVGRRLGLGTDTVDLLSTPEALADRAGLVLVDPWILAVAGGRARLESALKALPDWAVVVVVANAAERDVDDLLAETLELVRDHQHLVKHAIDPDGFVQLLPVAVTQARRRFLSRAPMVAPVDVRSTVRPRALLRLDEHWD